MAGIDKPPDGVGGDVVGRDQAQPQSYADRIKTNVRWNQRLKRNVLEITLEKKDRASDMLFDIDQESAARLVKILGIDIHTQVEGYQVKQKVLGVWLKEGISLDRFSKQESIIVNKDLRTGMIRPAGKTDVTVSIYGLDFNTPDSFVFDYLNKFGTVIKNEVIYGKHGDGLFKGKYNGDRRYQVDFSKSVRTMGTYHIIDAAKVRIFYPGNKKTCGRCYNFADGCPGGSIAKECEKLKGPRVSIIDHMRQLWEMIGFKPNNFEFSLDEDDKENAERVNDKTIKEATNFSPKLVRPEANQKDIDRYEGLTVQNFPKTLSDDDIFNLLKELVNGDLSDTTEIKLSKTNKNISASLEPLTPEAVQKMIQLIHFPETKKKFFGVPLYCRAVRAMTPQKSQNPDKPEPEPSPKPTPKPDPKPTKSTALVKSKPTN